MQDILLDFAKAFDKVPHKRLLSKLTSYGITGNTHNNIIGSYILYQIVSSESRLMEPCRTPQMLHMVSHRAQFWDLYSSCCTSTTLTKTFNRVSLFADDSIIYRKINSNIDNQIPQTDLIQLEKWSDKWQIQFNMC